MKKILITGKGSYIGTHFKEYMEQWPDKYQMEELDMLDPSWKVHDFSSYDVIYHVAGIAHQKVTDANKNFYKKVNYDLAIVIYGENSPGNLTKLFDIVRKVHIFPNIKNKNNYITIDYLVNIIIFIYHKIIIICPHMGLLKKR